MAQEQIKGDTGSLGSGGSMVTYTVPGSAVVTPYTVSATFDGTGAGGSFLPCLTFKTITGAVIARCPAPEVASGSTAEVSWFPHVASATSSAGTEQKFIGAMIRASAAGQNIPDNTDTDLTYASVEYDTDSMANLGSDDRILTVNTEGYYLVQCGTIWGYNNSGRRINLIFQNDYYSNPLAVSKVADSRMEPWDPFPGEGVGGGADNLCFRVLQASVGDFFSSGVFQNSGATINCNSGSGNAAAFLSASLIGV